MKPIYSISDPLFLSDTYIFSQNGEHHPFIKINSSNKIIEIGSDITKRMSFLEIKQCPITSIIKLSTPATKLQASIFRRIDEQYWRIIIDREVTIETKSYQTIVESKLDIDTKTKIFEKFKSGDDISVSLIQRKCLTGYFTASRTLENLIEDGLVKRGKTAHDVCRFL